MGGYLNIQNFKGSIVDRYDLYKFQKNSWRCEDFWIHKLLIDQLKAHAVYVPLNILQQ